MFQTLEAEPDSQESMKSDTRFRDKFFAQASLNFWVKDAGIFSSLERGAWSQSMIAHEKLTEIE